MKKEWPQRKLAEVILDIKDGGTPSRKNREYFGGNVYWCVVKDIKPLILDTTEKLTQEGLDNCSAKVWPVDSIIISLGATIGQIGIAKVPTATKQGLAGIVVNRQMMTPEFLAYGLLDQKEYIQSLATGATIREIRPSRFAETIQLPVPPLPEQQRIVGVLDCAFDGITTTKANAEKNLQNARDLFESHLEFVLEKRNEDCEKKPLETVASIINGYAFKSTDFTSKPGVKCIKITNVGVGKFVSELGDYLPNRFAGDYHAVSVSGGSIVLALTRTIIAGGLKVAVVPEEYDGALLNQRVASIAANETSLSAAFLFAYLSTQAVFDYVKERVNTLMQPNLSIKDVRLMPIPVPPRREQDRIAEHLGHMHAETQRLTTVYERKLGALQAFQKSLLHQAFSGQL